LNTPAVHPKIVALTISRFVIDELNNIGGWVWALQPGFSADSPTMLF